MPNLCVGMRLLKCTWLVLTAATVSAQVVPDTARATRTSVAVTLDGRLDEAAWASAPPIDHFRQRDPEEGAPASEASIVRLLYDAEFLYVGAMLHDRDPTGIVAAELRRDADLDGDDRFGLLLDTFGDHRHGFLFRVNANGTRFDAVIRSESLVDADWDEQWWAETQIVDEGWTVEMQIPFRILRFDPSATQRWGIDFERVIRRRNEAAFWANWDRDFRFIEVSQAGELVLSDRVAPAQRVRLRPYVLGGAEPITAGAREGRSRAVGEIGIDDLQITVAANLLANLAVNPDFAQTEIDEQRVNLTRFGLFFPEKRQFFVQGADSLRMRPPLEDGDSLELFHSRRIGLAADGRPVPLVVGGKLTGKVHDFDLGLFGGRSANDGRSPPEAFGVARFRRELLGRSSIGAIATVWNGAGAARSTLGADARFVLARHFTLGGMMARTGGASTREGWAHSIAAAWRTDGVEAEVSHLSVDPDFDPALGFVRRHDRQSAVEVSLNPRPSTGPIRQFAIAPELTVNRDRIGPVSREAGLRVGAEFQTGDELEFTFENTDENLREVFGIADSAAVPPGRYGWNSMGVEFESSEGRRLSGAVGVEAGGFYTGQRRSLEGRATIRAGRHVRVSSDYELNAVRLADGRLTTNLLGLRADIAASRDAAASLYFQYNSEGRVAATQVRISYLFRNIDNVHLVYNHTRVDRVSLSPVGRALILKLTYTLYR